jgi:two-component system response regulator RpfG
MNPTGRSLTLVHDTGEPKLAPLTVMIIDDQSTGRLVLSEIMRGLDAGVQVVTFADPLQAIEFARGNTVDMVLTDYKMPSMDGIEAIRRLRRIFGYEDIPIVCITVVNDRDVRYRALEAGATDFLIRPVDRLECGARCRNLLSLRRHELLKKNRTRLLEQKVDEATRELRRREVDTLFRLAKAAEQRDKVTGQHLTRMAKYSALIAREARLSEAEQEAIELAAPMHDIGKIGIPDRILQHAGKLQGEELETMRSHARIGYDLLKDSSSGYLQTAAVIALGHHERYDGEGYPTGLRGEHIPLEARIVAVADVYDALTSVRPYKEAWPAEQAFNYVREQKGRHFDPALADILLIHREEIVEIGETFFDTPPLGAGIR